ncbi:MAG: trimethylamine methyltransferase family protein [Pseudomonadota bacterium]|nr:trimethylamine methyltransferase family protein [Pseudomonadota bacterium]
MIFGSFSATISMQSGAPTFGGAEPAMALFASAAPPLATMVCR